MVLSWYIFGIVDFINVILLFKIFFFEFFKNKIDGYGCWRVIGFFYDFFSINGMVFFKVIFDFDFIIYLKVFLLLCY